jgi:uncharacterized protein (TIGR00369 family)
MTAPPWTPRNAAWLETVRESFARQPHMATLGATIARLEPGMVDIVAPYDPRFTQQNGFWHAGAVASLADSASGYAAYSLAAPETDVLTVEFKIDLMAPAAGTAFRAEGRVIRPGRTLTTCHAAVHAETDSGSRMIAFMTATLIIRPREA